MPTIIVQETSGNSDRDKNYAFDVALRRFRRACDKAGIPSKLRQLEFHEKRTTKLRRKRAAAVKRHHKKLQKERESLERERTRY